MRTFSQSLPMALLRAREAVMRRFRPGLRRHGVTEQQWRVLRALAHSGPMEVTELAGATFLLAPSLSRILPDMETRALIRRTQADADLRRSVISLEPKGCDLIATHAPYSEEIYDEIERIFGTERLAQLFSLLQRTRGSPAGAGGRARQGTCVSEEARTAGSGADPMSLYAVQKLIYQLNRDPAVRKRYDADFEALLAEYELSDEERRAFRESDIGLLYVMGVNGQLLMHYAALRGFEWNAYIEAMREGERKYGPVRTGLY